MIDETQGEVTQSKSGDALYPGPTFFGTASIIGLASLDQKSIVEYHIKLARSVTAMTDIDLGRGRVE
jgi:hypothetical protein